jgi:hypothetical protein
MKFQDLRAMGKAMGINTFQMGKTDLIQTIQRMENNVDCYGSRRVENCGEMACLWRVDCILINKSAPGSK